MIYKGNTKIQKLYKGSTRILRAYKGDTLVFGYEPNDVVFEVTSAGDYTFEMQYGAFVNVILVGGGGGGAKSHFFTDTRYRHGGQGAMISGNMFLEAGTYSVTVGSGGVSRFENDTQNTAYGDNGTKTEFLGNIAGGGIRAWSYSHGGSDQATGGGQGGTATVITEGLTGSSGANATTTSKYLTYGGGGNGNSVTRGQSGYFIVKVIGAI